MPFVVRGRQGPSSRRVAPVLLAMLFSVCGNAVADDLSTPDGALRRMQIDDSVKAAGDTPFGEQINPYIGSVSFKQADVVVPGNGPTISLVRETLTPRSNYRSLVPHALGDWTLSVPQIHTIAGKPGFGGGTIAEYWDIDSLTAPYARCTQIGPLDTDSVVNVLWWEGYEMVTEDGERQPLLKRDPGNTAKPTMSLNGQPVVFPAVTEKNWQIGCLPNTSNDEVGEAFLAVSPDGTKYWFDRLVGEELETIKEMDDGVIVRQSLRRARMLVTRIEDRFGNYLTYAYDGAKLTSITASDGRRVDIAWRADYDLVDSITVQPAAPQPHVWRYEYTNLGDTTSQLTGVVLPDLTRWSFSLHPQTSRIVTNLKPCGIRGVLPASSQTAIQTVTSPTGAVGNFIYKQTWHARYVDSACVQLPNMDPYEDTPALFEAQSLIRKEISGPGLATQAWTYAYSPAIGAATYDPCAANGTCPTSKWVDVTEPDGNRMRYTHSIVNGTDGRLLGTDHYQGASQTPLRSATYEYAAANQGPWPVMLGSPMANENPAGAIFHRTPMKKRTIVQQGTTYLWQVDSFDNFAQPLSVTRSSTPGGYARTDTTLYDNNFGKWVIGQVAKSTNTNTGMVESETVYDANAMPWKIYAFGKLRQTLIYDTASAIPTGQRGTLKTAIDGNNNVTTFANWKRGIPQTVTFADTQSKSVAVNDLGLITSATDENGYKSCYDYDAAGRLAGITYPSESQNGICNTTTWNKTTSSFGPRNVDEYGLAPGHWRQWIWTGNGHKYVYYDALWRPVLTREFDSNDASTERFVARAYDQAGRETFVSYARATAPPVSDALGLMGDTDAPEQALPGCQPQPQCEAPDFQAVEEAGYAPQQEDLIAQYTGLGVRTTYDTLGRVRQVDQDSELGVLSAYTNYLGDAQGAYAVVTHPRGAQTRTWYRSYDQPSQDAPVAIQHPGSAYTDIVRDVFGKPSSITRRNVDGSLAVTRSYAYDTFQQLCRTVEPETGATLLGYDAAGNLKWSSAGLAANTACEDTGTSSLVEARRVDRTYDARNRPKTLAFPDGLGNQTWTYTPDGLTDNIVTQNDGANTVTNRYTYNRRRLPIGEQLQWGSVDWSLGYTYNGNGHLASQTQPTAAAVTFVPNALGQPTQVGSYATGVKYHPNGAIKQFTYGNLIVHNMVQNARGLPETSRDTYGPARLDDAYLYDANGNVDSITDALAGNRGHRTMQYDTLDRLTQVDSPMFGTATYAYDKLDNLTRVTIGGTAARDHYYCYDTHNQLTNLKTGSCNGISVIGLGYDAQGNLNNKNGIAFVFDYGNRLRSTSAGTSSYVYDGHGRRVRDVVNGVSKYSVYSQSGQLAYASDLRTGQYLNYFYLGGSLVATVETPHGAGTAVTKYQHTDALGSPVAVTDANRTVIERSEYEPYGKVINHALNDGPGYTGHVADAATGMIYMQQRYYDDDLGKFPTVDPVTATSVGGNFNRYWYANNNPYRFTDPDGRQPLDADVEKMRAKSDGLGGGIRNSISTSFRSPNDYGPVSRSYQSWPAGSHKEINKKDKPDEGSGYYGSCRGRGCSRPHMGIDAVGDETTPIHAFRGGVVTRADNKDKKGYGNQVVIKHSDGISTRYGHLGSYNVSVGDSVREYETIGIMGRSGNTPREGDTHLHFEVTGPTGTQDPLNYFPELKP